MFRGLSIDDFSNYEEKLSWACQNINFGFEVGKRGTTNAGLIKEKFFSVRLGLTLNDRWFVKNKYN